MLFQLMLFSQTPGSPTVLTFNTFVDAALKLLFILGGLIYLVFAFVVVRQIQVMKNTLVTPFTPVVQILGFLHLIFALLILFWFITVL